MNPKYLVWDIETIPESELSAEWRESDDYKKDIERQNCLEGEEPFAPLVCHKIITIGVMVLDVNLHVVRSGILAGGSAADDEKGAVEKWNEIVRGSSKTGDPLSLVDWNGKKFDAPVLQYRGFRYGISMDWFFGKLKDNHGKISQWSKSYRDRYGGKHLDLVEEWTNHGSFRKCRLKDLARLMGLPGKVGIDGSKVHGAWREKRFKEIDDYCLEDVWHTGLVMMRMRFLAGGMTKDEYVTAAELLLAHTAAQDGHKAFSEAINTDRLLLKA